MITDLPISKLRQETPGCANRIHLNNAGAGLMPLPVIDAIKEYIDLEANIGGYEAAAQEAIAINGFYTSTAKLLNTKPENIAFTTNATDSYNKALSTISFKEGDIILTTRQDYASNQIAFLLLKKRFDIEIIRAENTQEGPVDLNSIESLINKHNPKLVAVTHVPTNTGLIQPVEAIGEICAKEEILYLVDACQSVGQLNVDLEKLCCDFLSVTMRKFMRGPRGAGFLYVSDRILQSDMEAFFTDMRGGTWTEANAYSISTTARRFELWERAYALMLGSKAACDYALEVGLDKIEQRVKYLAAIARKRLAEIPGIRILDHGTNLCGIYHF